MFPVERCTIYDAGSRAFEAEVYLQDVLDYWKQIQSLETDYEGYLKERFPGLNPSRFEKVTLEQLAGQQIGRDYRPAQPPIGPNVRAHKRIS